MRVLIVDDEPPARARLARLLAAHPDVQVVGHAGDAATALALVAERAPDALLLDIQMPGASGLDLCASLPEPAPAVVFVTAHEQHALAAFDTAAVDYLLKPVEPERLARALQRLRPAQPTPLRPQHLLVPDRGRTHVLPLASICWLEAADNYVVVHTATQAPLMRRTLAGLLADLGPGFLRTHRGAAVALAQVAQVQPDAQGGAQLLLHGGARVPCSRPYRAALLARLAQPGPAAG